MAPRILVCGGRDFRDWRFLADTLDRICEERGWQYEPDADGNTMPLVEIINGGARGADLLAEDWAISRWCKTTAYPADWARWGNAAGPIRNKQMLDEGKPDLIIAFPGGRGTHDMVSIARARGIEVLEVTK